MPKAKGKVQKTTVTGSVVRIDYPSIRKFVQVDVSTFSASLALAAAVHGVKQRLGDAESGGSAAEKYEMASRIVEEAFANDSWELTTRIVDPKLVVEAMARVKGVSIEDVRAVLEKKGEDALETVKEWRGNAKVKAAMLAIQAERAAEVAAESDDDEPSLD